MHSDLPPLSAPDEPAISVVIPLYNKGRHIKETLAGVIAQTYQNWRLIVVDDGSTDDSLAAARSVQDPRIQVVHQPNQGVCAARNRGLRESTTEYVAFLDADDLWYPWHLEELNQLMQAFPGQGIYSVAHRIRRRAIRYAPKQPFEEGFQGVVSKPLRAFSVSLSLVHSSTACLNRNQLLAQGGFPEGVKKGEDVYVWLRAALDNGLAYSTRFCAEYNQDAEHRVSADNNPEIPYYLSWLDHLVDQKALTPEQEADARQLLFSGVFFNAAGFRLGGNQEAFRNLTRLRVSLEPVLRRRLTLLRWIPRPLLSLARQYRHRRHR